MQRGFTSAALLALLAAAGCADQPAASRPQASLPAALAAAGQDQALPDRYIVVLKPGAGARTLADATAAAHGGTVHHVYGHALEGFAATLPQAAVQALHRNPRVAYIEPDQMMQPTTPQHSPPSWGLDRVDQRSLPLNAVYNYWYGGSGVHAYVIDSGLRATHADFTGRVGNGWSFVADGRGTGDCNGHGTHVAGTFGGTSYGVAKRVTVHPVRVFPCSGGAATSTVIAAVDTVTARAIKPAVVNMSLTGPASTSLDDAVRRSIASGITYVVAAGNNNGANACNYSPARVSEALTVGATTSSDARASFSNVGSCVDLFAPGEGIRSTWVTGDGASEVLDGTSMASPHVAGAAALYLDSNPSATPSRVHSEILANATANKVGNPGSGSPNRLLFTLERLRLTISGPGSITTGGTYTWTVTATGGEVPGSYTYSWDARVMDPCGTYNQYGISTSSSYSQEVWPDDPDFYLYPKVTSGGETVTGTKFVNPYYPSAAC